MRPPVRERCQASHARRKIAEVAAPQRVTGLEVGHAVHRQQRVGVARVKAHHIAALDLDLAVVEPQRS